MTDAVIVDIIRTPSAKGKPGGALSGTHPVDLLSTTLQALAERTGIDPERIDDVIAGCVGQAGEQSLNIGRNALLGAGWPESVPATTIDRQCGSSQQALHFAAQGVLSGAYDVVVACGVESMSRVPMGSSTMGADPLGSLVHKRYPDGLVNQGVSAELIANKWGFDRKTLDEYSARSHQRAAKAAAAGDFDNELIKVAVTGPDGQPAEFGVDETVRGSTTAEKLGDLPTSFSSDAMRSRFPDIDWRITPGNSSPLTDGASAALITSAEKAKELGLTPRARFTGFAVAGSDPLYMLTGPIPATEKILARTGLSIADLDSYEVNEAFASVPLAWQAELTADPDKLNPRGGAIALGHPLGASGVKLMAGLVNYLESTGGRYGLQTMCEGGGMANATIVERLG